MQKLHQSSLIILFVSSAMFCKAQLVQMPVDAKLLEINEKKIIDKPLETLFNEIKPPIRRVVVSPGGGGETNSFFIFYFVDDEEYYNLKKESKTPISIRVYTKEIINWDLSGKAKNDWRKWGEDDAKKYGNLTVRAIRVSGIEQ